MLANSLDGAVCRRAKVAALPLRSAGTVHYRAFATGTALLLNAMPVAMEAFSPACAKALLRVADQKPPLKSRIELPCRASDFAALPTAGQFRNTSLQLQDDLWCPGKLSKPVGLMPIHENNRPLPAAGVV